jgi:hypothetical protein
MECAGCKNFSVPLLYWSACCFLIFFGVPSLHSQQSSASDTLERIRPLPTQKIEQKPLADKSGEGDLGEITEIKRIKPPDTWTVFSTQSLFHTNNVTLRDDALPKKASTAWLGRWGGTVVPYSTQSWTPTIQLTYETVRYENASEEDFNSQSIALGQRLNITKDGNLYWAPTYTLQRFERPRGEENEFYKQGILDNDIGWLKPLHSGEGGNLYLTASGSLIWRHSSPAAFDRLTQQGFLSLLWLPVQQIRIQPYANTAYHTYLTDTALQSNRNDLSFTSGIAVAWTPIKHFTIEANFNYTINESNELLADYELIEPSLTLGGIYSF